MLLRSTLSLSSIFQIICFVVILMSGLFARAEDFPYAGVDTTPSTEYGTVVHDTVVDTDQGFVKKLLVLLGLDQFASGSNPDSGETAGGTNYIRFLLNMAISFAAFIALLVLLYGFGSMLFEEEEAGLTKAKNVIRGAAIAIAILGVSWFIVSAFFYVFDAVKNVG